MKVNAKALDSKSAAHKPGPPATSDGRADAIDDLDLKSRLVIKEEQGTKAGRKSKQSSAVTAKAIDSKSYHRLEKRLQSKKSPFDLPRSASFSNLSYVDSAPLSPLTTEFGGKALRPVLSRDRTGGTQSRSSTEIEQDALQSICSRLAVAITQHSTDPRLSASTSAGPPGSAIVFHHPFSQQQPKLQSPALYGDNNCATTHSCRSHITIGQHEAFERKLLENAAVLCEE